MEYKEATASVTYSLKTSGGFPVLFTMRGDSEDDLLNRMAVQEQYFASNGFTAQEKGYKGYSKTPKTIEYVEGRTCPKCGSKLIYFEAKGVKHIKCSTAKYDFMTKTSSGCDFVEWADSPKTTTSTGSSEMASEAQRKLIMDKWPELWLEGMTKAQASEVINSNFKK